MKTSRFGTHFLVAALAAPLFALAGAGPALAGSALDQYVEQVPTPVGTAPAPSPKPKPPKATSRPGPGTATSGATAPVTPQTDAATAAARTVAPKRRARKRHRRHRLQPRATRADRASSRQPGRGEAWGQAAESAGLNLPLTGLAVLAVLAMAGLKLARRREGSQ